MSNYSVYVLTSPDGKRYVGMTRRKPEYRWNNGKGYDYNEELRQDIARLGWDSFTKEIAFSGLDRDTACSKERLLIKKYRTQDPEFGYNKEMGGVPSRLASQTKVKMSESHKGLERNEEYRRHISESKVGAKNGMYGMSGSLNVRSRRVKARNEDRTIMFESICEAARSLGLSKNAFKNISACCVGKRRTAYGYVWSYEND